MGSLLLAAGQWFQALVQIIERVAAYCIKILDTGYLILDDLPIYLNMQIIEYRVSRIENRV